MFFRSLEDNVERSAEDGFVTCEVSEGSLNGLYQSHLLSSVTMLWFWLVGAEEPVVINN